MSRPFIEFIQSQRLAWEKGTSVAGRQGVEVKLLSRDAESGASTALLRYPPGWSMTDHWCDVDEELFLLSGDIALNGRRYTCHHYAYWPAGFIRRNFIAGPSGAMMIACFTGRPRLSDQIEAAPDYAAEALVEQLDTFSLRWDQTNMDPNIAHLNAYRKNLRLAPDGGGRTYLLAGLPQGFPASGSEPLERHPHVEEMFMVAGDMPCSLGVMRAGAYFWRPPMIWHGADCTLNGFLLFARTPGSNVTISEWAKDPHPVSMTPKYRPSLPADLAAIAGTVDDPVQY